MYTSHPSKVLNQLFQTKPYQGVNPHASTYLFVGLDANYGETLEHSGIFQHVQEYHEDGVSFWRKYGVHHPFLLPGYTGDGRFYHKSFARIGFRPDHASLVSFVELLHVPTCGRNRLTPDDLSHSHLIDLNRAITDGAARHIFIPDGVARLMRASRCFPWLPEVPRESRSSLKVWFESPQRTVYCHYHLSVYGKFQEEKLRQLSEIGELLQEA